MNLTPGCQSQQLQPSCEQNCVNPLIVSEGTILLWRVTADMAGSSEAGPCVNFIVVFYKPSINLRIYTVTFVIQVTFTVYIIVFDFFHFTTLHSTYTTSGPKKLGHCVKC